MFRRKRETKPPPLPTVWRVPDELWAKVEPILAQYDPPKPVGRFQRRALDGIIYLRSGVQWNQLPLDDSSVHRTFQRWVKNGVFDRIWAVLVAECEELGGVDWQWQAADTSMGKARWGKSPTPQTGARRG